MLAEPTREAHAVLTTSAGNMRKPRLKINTYADPFFKPNGFLSSAPGE